MGALETVVCRVFSSYNYHETAGEFFNDCVGEPSKYLFLSQSYVSYQHINSFFSFLYNEPMMFAESIDAWSLIIIPALFVAQHAGQEVFVDGHLIGEGQLIFNILPTLFSSMGDVGLLVSFAFFALLSIAALTSTISSTEVPVAYLVEDKAMTRKKATWLISGVVFITSMLLIAFFEQLFGLVIQVLTTILQPLMSLFYFIVVGWLWQRGNQLTDIAQLNQHKTLRFLGFYIRFICTVLLLIVFVNVAF
jgi:NSS family neurotransmitter:Na+ symporter